MTNVQRRYNARDFRDSRKRKFPFFPSYFRSCNIFIMAHIEFARNVEISFRYCAANQYCVTAGYNSHNIEWIESLLNRFFADIFERNSEWHIIYFSSTFTTLISRIRKAFLFSSNFYCCLFIVSLYSSKTWIHSLSEKWGKNNCILKRRNCSLHFNHRT